jgi:hypothetical protein
MNVGEIASSSASDQNFLAQAFRAFENGDALPALSRLDRAHQSGRASAQDNCVELMNQGAVTCRTD